MLLVAWVIVKGGKPRENLGTSRQEDKLHPEVFCLQNVKKLRRRKKIFTGITAIFAVTENKDTKHTVFMA